MLWRGGCKKIPRALYSNEKKCKKMFQFLLTIPRIAVSLMSLVFALFQGNLQLSQERKERKKNTKKFFEKVEKDRNKKE